MSERQLCLLPERMEQFGPSLHGAETAMGAITDLAQSVSAQVGELAVLEVVPDLLDRIELGSVRRQELDLHCTVLRLKPAANQTTAMGFEAVPDDQKRPLGQLRTQHLKKLHDLGRSYGAREQPEVKAPQREPCNGGDLLPGKRVLDNGRLSARRPRAHNGRALREA